VPIRLATFRRKGGIRRGGGPRTVAFTHQKHNVLGEEYEMKLLPSMCERRRDLHTRSRGIEGDQLPRGKRLLLLSFEEGGGRGEKIQNLMGNAGQQEQLKRKKASSIWLHIE